MSGIVFLPGFDGDASLRAEFVEALRAAHEVRAVSYPSRALGSLDAYRVHAMGEAPVDWKPVLVAESFGGLVAARWAALDARVRALVLCGSFARNPVGLAAALGASWPGMVKLGPLFTNPIAHASGDPRRRRWAEGFGRALGALPDEVIAERLRLIAAEDVGPALAALRIPVVVVQFDGDLVIGPGARAHLERVCHNPHVLRLPGPHFALETRPAECARAIGERLAAVLGERA
jgi:pimeloyl-ACP methyl ester carboxylesterase